jgi:hypothetical protein
MNGEFAHHGKQQQCLLAYLDAGINTGGFKVGITLSKSFTNKSA